MIWKHKDKPKQEWKSWFAWTPVPIGRFPISEGNTVVWLEWIERKWVDCRYTNSYEYRFSEKG